MWQQLCTISCTYLWFGGKHGVWSVECGVWKMRRVESESVKNAGCGKSGAWKMRSVENGEYFNFNMKLTNNVIPLYSH